MNVLSINCGSSSVKWATFRVAADSETRLGHGAEEGSADEAIDNALEAAAETGGAPDAIAHRVVHGGPKHDKPALIDDPLRKELSQLVDYAPLHMPAALDAIDGAKKKYPNVPMVACFDTAFHHDMPEVARVIPLPRELDSDGGLRRYGFHGLSCESALHALPEARNGRTVLAHLGSGSSVTAMLDGKSVDTTMSFTPAGGVVMATRTGDLDPGVTAWLVTHKHLDGPKLNELFEKKSGLLALSGSTGDMRKLLDVRKGDARAELAVQMYIYSVCKAIGSLTAALGGIDRLIFTGGIGERSDVIRDAITTALAYLRIPAIHVVPADEERIMARHAFEVVPG